jgi:hypothetical protein
LPCGERTLKLPYCCMHTLRSSQTSAVHLLLYFDSKQLAHSFSIIQVTNIYDQSNLHVPNTNAKQKCILVPVAVQSKVWVCGRSPAEIVGLNPTGGMDVCLL